MTEIVTDPTSTQAKQEINCCDAKYWDLLNTGELEGYYVGRTLRVTRESIEAFKKRHRYTPRKDLKGRGAVMEKRKREEAVV